MYALPVPYATQCTVNVGSYMASLLHPDMLEALTPVRTTGDGNCLWNAISICLCGNEKYTYTLQPMVFKERMIPQIRFQNPDETESNHSRCLRIAITPFSWGADFHIYVISIVLNIPIFMFTSFVCDRTLSYYIDHSLNLSQ